MIKTLTSALTSVSTIKLTVIASAYILPAGYIRNFSKIKRVRLGVYKEAG